MLLVDKRCLVLVVRDRFTKAIFSHLVPAKGTEHYYPEIALLRDIKFLGYTSLTLKSDQEPSIIALATAVKNTLSSQGISVQLENSPKGDSHGMSNGEAESSVGITQGLARTLKDHVEHKVGQQLDPRSPILGWLIEYVGTLYTLFSFDEKARDGLTAFRRIKGRDWTVALPAFGERVGYRVKTNHKLEPRWESGIFLGVRLHTTEEIIGTPKEVVVVQSVRRKPDDQQWNLQLLQSITGTPWAPNPAKQKEPREALELPEPVSIEPEQPEEEVRQVETSELKPHFRRVYLRQDDFDKFGYSAGCKACALIRSGLDRQGVNHAEDCRLRIVQRLQETEYGRRRIEIAAKREEEAKQDASKRQRLALQDVGVERASGPSSGPGIKRPAEDPPQDPRLEDPEQPGGIVASTRQPGTKRDVEQAGLSSDPMEDVETSLTKVVLSQRQGFLGAVYAQVEQSPETLPVCEENFGIDPEEPLYWDNVSGKPLDTAKVQEARREECQVIDAMGVWEVIDRPANERVISTRWVDVNKGDETHPKYGSRFVARELKQKSDFFASMPPITALRALFTLAVTMRVPNLVGKLAQMDPTTCLIFIDVKKAHFWSPARRRLLVELPSGMGYPPGKVGLLRKSLYGTRDAPANWEAAIKAVMMLMGFQQAKSNSCLYYHAEKQIRIEVHGDDFTGVGPKTELEWFAAELRKHWTIDVRGILGPHL